MLTKTLVSALILAAPLAAFAQGGASKSAASVIPAQIRPMSDFARLPFLQGVEMSPDGTRVLAAVPAGDQKALGVVSLATPDKPVLIGLGDNDLIDWRWVNKDWIVVRLGDQGMIEAEPFYVTRVVAISADGKTVRTLANKDPGQNAEVLWAASDGTPRVLISYQKSLFEGLNFWPTVAEVDVSNGKTKNVAGPVTGVFNWYADNKGVVRMGIQRDFRAGTSKLLYRGNANGSFTGVAKADTDNDERLIVPSVFPNGSGPALAFSDHEGIWSLYELDLATMETGNKSIGVAGYDLEAVHTNPVTGEAMGVSVVTTRTRTQWLDPKLASIQASVEKSVGGGQLARIVSYDSALTKFVLFVGSGSSAGSYYVYDATNSKLQRLAMVNEALGTSKLGPVSTFKYKARDNLEIPAILTLPSGRQASKLPLILMPHGGPIGVRDSEDFDWWAQAMANLGYAVVQPNYRGSGGYGRAFEKKGDGEWGLKMQDDLNDAVAHLAKAGTIDPKRVCIVGGSYGGYAAMRGAQRDGQQYRCAISFAGVSDLPGMKRYDNNFLYARSFRRYWKERAPDLKAVSPLNFAGEFSAPILIIHGAKDKRVPVKQSRELADKLKVAGKTYRYVEQPKGDHHFSRQEDRLQFLEESAAFLKQYNPAN